MIAVNRPPDIKEFNKSKIMSLTQRDVDPITSNAPVFINERILPTSIECFPSEDGRQQTCIFINQYGQKSIIKYIGFINQQVSRSTVNVYRHPNGTLRTRMDFEIPPICEIFGVHPSLTLKCSDGPTKNTNVFKSSYR